MSYAQSRVIRQGQDFGVVEAVPVGTYADDQNDAAQSGRIILARAFSSGGTEYNGTAVPVAAVPVGVVPPPAFGYVPSAISQTGTLPDKFMRYDELGNLIQSLGDATGARQQGERQLAAATQQYEDNDRALQKNRASQPRAERRLHRNAHPRFLHYLQFNREAKVKRLEQELQALRDDERRRDEQKVQLGALVDQRREELASYQATESQMKGAHAERQRLFDSVVDSQPPSQNLTSLRFRLQSSENDHRAETILYGQVENCLRQVQGARQMFGRAHEQLRRAMNMNIGAGAVNFGQAFDNRRGGFGADDVLERGLQMQRDRLLNEARDTALRAADQLQAAFDTFPMEARVRYPQLTANICNAPLPNLRGANFFGTVAVGWAFGGFGDAMNDMYAGQKLRNNMQVLAECEHMAAIQEGAVQMVVTSIRQHLNSVEDDCRRLQSSIKSERNNIFEITRRRTFGMG